MNILVVSDFLESQTVNLVSVVGEISISDHLTI
jgi:hypothetical protein